jgi:hypothetical protein
VNIGVVRARGTPRLRNARRLEERLERERTPEGGSIGVARVTIPVVGSVISQRMCRSAKYQRL